MHVEHNMNLKKFTILLRELRVNQWVKNLVVFTAIIFSGKLFNGSLFLTTVWAFLIFCLLSSTSYVLNDIIDYPYDVKHPIKKNRPVAAGSVTIQEATFIVFVLTLISLLLSLLFSLQFFFLAVLFILLHFFYSLFLKKFPVIDIFSISASFMLRAFAGEVVTGFHIPIWLLLTIFFVSLFMATVKRHAELVAHGRAARSSLLQYNEHHLTFLTTTFATITIISYSFYTYFQQLSANNNILTSDFFDQFVPQSQSRRWMMITIPLVVYGIARYAQLLYERVQGERPEHVITKDIPLTITIATWGIIVIALFYG